MQSTRLAHVYRTHKHILQTYIKHTTIVKTNGDSIFDQSLTLLWFPKEESLGSYCIFCLSLLPEGTVQLWGLDEVPVFTVITGTKVWGTYVQNPWLWQRQEQNEFPGTIKSQNHLTFLKDIQNFWLLSDVANTLPPVSVPVLTLPPPLHVHPVLRDRCQRAPSLNLTPRTFTQGLCSFQSHGE